MKNCKLQGTGETLHLGFDFGLIEIPSTNGLYRSCNLIILSQKNKEGMQLLVFRVQRPTGAARAIVKVVTASGKSSTWKSKPSQYISVAVTKLKSKTDQ